MPEDYKIQINTMLNKQLTNLRANSAEEFQELVEGLAERSEAIIEALNQAKQAFLAKDILTINPVGDDRSSVSSGDSSSGGIPRCKHGEMKDCRGMTTKAGQPYRADYYCQSKDKDDQCKPIKL